MEEDIKILKDLKNKWELNAFGDMVNVLSLDEIKALENLLKDYKQIKSELNSVKEIYYTQAEVDTNYIPISVIQNKINWHKNYEGTVLYKKYNYELIIQVLQGLLEERNK